MHSNSWFRHRAGSLTQAFDRTEQREPLDALCPRAIRRGDFGAARPRSALQMFRSPSLRGVLLATMRTPIGERARLLPERKRATPAIARYIEALRGERKRRFIAVRACVLQADPTLTETACRRMPVFTKGRRWVSLASRKRYLAVHFCDPKLLEGIRARHPELDCGLRCVRIRDSQHVPIYELRAAFVRAFASGQPGGGAEDDRAHHAPWIGAATR